MTDLVTHFAQVGPVETKPEPVASEPPAAASAVAVHPPANDNVTLSHQIPKGLTKEPHQTLNQFLAGRDRFRDATKKEVATGGLKDVAIAGLCLAATILTGGAALPLLLLGAPLAIAGRHAMADKEHRNEYFHQLDGDKLNNTVHWLAREEKDPTKQKKLQNLADRFHTAQTKNNVDDMIEVLNKLEEMANRGAIDHHIDFSSMKSGVDTSFDAKAGRHVTSAHFVPGPTMPLVILKPSANTVESSTAVPPVEPTGTGAPLPSVAVTTAAPVISASATPEAIPADQATQVAKAQAKLEAEAKAREMSTDVNFAMATGRATASAYQTENFYEPMNKANIKAVTEFVNNKFQDIDTINEAANALKAKLRIQLEQGVPGLAKAEQEEARAAINALIARVDTAAIEAQALVQKNAEAATSPFYSGPPVSDNPFKEDDPFDWKD